MKRNSIDTRSGKRYLRHTTKSRIERSPGAGRSLCAAEATAATIMQSAEEGW
ncbi:MULTISPECIES: hypothetical protein [Rhizobium]|uniref:hypothetical protein n=1 Tax=Rhizobium TaxID=379 RepID=UPI00156FCE0A|nr:MULTISPECIES: hypothetical protein [Rhizobium]MBA1349908.1 hypothetical protein [Rhizobium sp. WYCCWR 11146]NYT33540.1 hypothetical protein [Rhizobium sp. WYCCWR 11128]QKK33084.1 hypothetical protein FE844_026080 [Rhizobium indicum]